MAGPGSQRLPPQFYADRGPGIVVGVVVLGVLAAISVFLRIISRQLKGLTLGSDDWLIILSLVRRRNRNIFRGYEKAHTALL